MREGWGVEEKLTHADSVTELSGQRLQRKKRSRGEGKEEFNSELGDSVSCPAFPIHSIVYFHTYSDEEERERERDGNGIADFVSSGLPEA